MDWLGSLERPAQDAGAAAGSGPASVNEKTLVDHGRIVRAQQGDGRTDALAIHVRRSGAGGTAAITAASTW